MRYIFLSPSVSSGSRIAYLFCVEDSWIAISEEDKDDMYIEKEFNDSKSDTYEVITEEELYKRIPILRNQLTEEEEKFIMIDYENGKVYINPKHKLKSVFTDNSARATNQANFTANIWTYVINRKSYYFKIIFISILIIIASYLISWAILNLLFWFLFYTYFSTLGAIDNYNVGTLNASIVITKWPTRIAVLTDLSMGLGKYPVVRICKMKIPRKYNKINERIPVSCGYQNVEDQNFWDYVMPNPLVYATNNEKAIQQKINEIPTQEWIDLKSWIKTNRSNFYEGYYPIRADDNNWKEYENPKFSAFFEEKKPVRIKRR
ncbi:MAG: DUF3239 domain-containing protein [Chitinophagales bacterium]|nr:DUF3239 domain-containing protein [Chitinophagales bacterium]